MHYTNYMYMELFFHLCIYTDSFVSLPNLFNGRITTGLRHEDGD